MTATRHRFAGLRPGSFRTRGSAFAKRRENAALHLGQARDALDGFDRDCHLFGVTKGQFSMIDIAAAVLEKTGPADVAVWTWCIADYEVEAIGAFLQSGEIAGFRLVLDWAGAQRDMPIIADLQGRFGDDCIRVTKTHAKLVMVSNAAWRVVIRGSMNLNANPRFEQFDVSDGGPAWEVMSGVMGELWARSEPLPVQKLKYSEAVASLDAPAAPSAAVPSLDWAAGGKADWWDDGRA
jgi:hypothetical protein